MEENDLPFVSVCTPTFNRRPFIENMFECFRNQTYPKEKMEWIIVDDGTDKIKDLVDKANIPQIKYFAVNEKMKLGKKRNFMHEKTSGSILVYMDDDDYYPPQRVQHAVDKFNEKYPEYRMKQNVVGWGEAFTRGPAQIEAGVGVDLQQAIPGFFVYVREMGPKGVKPATSVYEQVAKEVKFIDAYVDQYRADGEIWAIFSIQFWK